MKHVEVYNFHKLLAGGVNGQAIFQQCAEIFARFLDKQLNILLTTLFGKRLCAKFNTHEN